MRTTLAHSNESCVSIDEAYAYRQVDRRPDDCRICFKPTTSSVSERKKRLALFGFSAEPVCHIIKTYVLESLLIPDFSFEELHFQAGDCICFSCITLLNSYDKAKKRFHELEQSVRTSLLADVGSMYPLRRSKTDGNRP